MGQELPFKVDNPKNVRFNPASALRVWDRCLYNVAHDVNPEHPPRIVASVTLRLAVEANNLIDTRNGEVTVYLREWNAGMWASAVTLTAAQSIIPRSRIKELAQWSLGEANSQVSVEELRKPQ